ncbi:left-handed beta-roll domain-containing protein, partial [Fusobacterium necrophorum]
AAAGKGSIAIGSATEAEGENSVVIGKESKTKKLSDMSNNESNGKEKMKISEEVRTRLMKKSENEDLSGSKATVILGASSIATGKH